MRYLLLSMVFLGLVAVGACSNDEPAPGAAGGACRVGLSPCNAGLVCADGACRADPGETPVALDVTFKFLQNNEIRDDLALYANGTDTAGIQLSVFRRDTGEPYEGAIYLWLEPPSAGTLSDVQVPLEGGVARVVFRACSNEDPACPDRARLKVADALRPLEVVAVAPTLILFGGNPPSTGAGGEGGGGGAGGEGGGGPSVIPGSARDDTPYTWQEDCNNEDTFNLGDGAVDFKINAWSAVFRNDGFYVEVGFEEPSSGISQGAYSVSLLPFPSARQAVLSDELVLTLKLADGQELTCTQGDVRLHRVQTVGEPAVIEAFRLTYTTRCEIGGRVQGFTHCMHLVSPP